MRGADAWLLISSRPGPRGPLRTMQAKPPVPSVLTQAYIDDTDYCSAACLQEQFDIQAFPIIKSQPFPLLSCPHTHTHTHNSHWGYCRFLNKNEP